MYDELPVYKASYDVLLDVFQFSANFTREYKFSIGERLKKEAIGLIILVFRANSVKNKFDILQQAREQIELMRLLIRLLKDSRQISLKSIVRINERIENVSKQLAGWQKSQKHDRH